MKNYSASEIEKIVNANIRSLWCQSFAKKHCVSSEYTKALMCAWLTSGEKISAVDFFDREIKAEKIAA